MKQIIQQEQPSYTPPQVDVFEFNRPLSLLSALSLDGELEDFEDTNDEF